MTSPPKAAPPRAETLDDLEPYRAVARSRFRRDEDACAAIIGLLGKVRDSRDAAALAREEGRRAGLEELKPHLAALDKLTGLCAPGCEGRCCVCPETVVRKAIEAIRALIDATPASAK